MLQADSNRIRDRDSVQAYTEEFIRWEIIVHQ